MTYSFTKNHRMISTLAILCVFFSLFIQGGYVNSRPLLSSKSYVTVSPKCASSTIGTVKLCQLMSLNAILPYHFFIAPLSHSNNFSWDNNFRIFSFFVAEIFKPPK